MSKRILTIAVITAMAVTLNIALVMWLVWVLPAAKHIHAPTKIELPPHFHLEFLHGHSEFHKHIEGETL